MCTCLIAGCKTTVSGDAMLGANDDWDGVPGVLTHVSGAEYDHGSYILTGGAPVPQVKETYGYVYTACKYAIGNLDRGWAGGMNERGVAVAGTGVDAFKPVEWKDKGYLLEPDDIPLLILQRGTGARQAVRMIGDVINAYGLRPSYLEGSAGSSAATFSVADRKEGWVLEVYPGRCWVAVRVPDDCVSVRVNAFGTHDADLTDPENTMCSPRLAEYARERGFWSGDERHFDFASSFGSDTSPTEWGPEKAPMNRRRRWRAMFLTDGIIESEETLRYLARPQAGLKGAAGRENGDRGGKLTKKDFMDILSDVYEGTPYDLKKVPEGGPHHDPFAGNMPDYALCRRGTVASFVTDYAGEEKEPLMWTAMGIPRIVPYIPIWTDIGKLPKCCEQAEEELFREEAGAEISEADPASQSLSGEMKRLCLHVQKRYDEYEAAAMQAKEKYQSRMDSVIREELSCGAGQDACSARYGKGRTAAAAAHIREALKVCMALREKKPEESVPVS